MYIFCIPEIFKINVLNRFFLLNLCSRVVISQKSFCSQKAGACDMFVFKISGIEYILFH